MVATFWISTIFLDGEGILHRRKIEEKIGLTFCFRVHSCIGKSHIQFFHFFCHICRTTVCWDPEILLPRQRDVTTSYGVLWLLTGTKCGADIMTRFGNHTLPGNRPFPSSPGPLFQNEGRCSAFDMEIIFHSHANKTHFHKKGCAPSLILKVRVSGTRKWPIDIYKTVT